MDTSLFRQVAEMQDGHWWFRGRRRIVHSVLRRYLPPTENRRLFDVRCGTGEMADLLREFGTVSGIDPAPEAVEHCRRRFADDVDVRVGAIPDDLPAPGEVDVVAAFDVLEALADDRAALAAIHRVLPSGGVLVVTAAAFEFLWGPHDEMCGHRRRYGRGEMRERLEGAGFGVDLLSYFNTWLFPAAGAASVVRRFRGWEEPRSRLTMPGPVANRVLLGVLASEAPLIGRWSPPAGASLVAVARRP